MTSGIIDDVILTAIDKGLASLGESPKQAIWFCLEKDFNFDRNKVPENVEAFAKVLQSFFGLGYNFLESIFIENLSEATGEDLSSQLSFVECVTRLRMKASEKPLENVTIDGESFVLSGSLVEK
jgi:hypothetical protein